MKRFLSLALVAALFLACLPGLPLCVQTWASSEGPLDTMIRWVISSDGTLTVSSLWGADMKDYASASATPWYSRRGEIKAVVVTDTITGIGSYAFADCKNLTRVTIADSVTGIGRYAFSGCESLESIELPQGITSVDEGMFQGCSSLERVTLASTVTELGYAAFSGCKSLTAILLPAGLASIAYSTFANCDGLVSVFFLGTQAQKDSMNIGGGNDSLISANWYYEITRHNVGGQLYYLCGKCGLRYNDNGSMFPFKNLSILTKPEKRSYLVGEKLSLEGLCLEGTYADGTVVYLGAEELENVSANLDAIGKGAVTVYAGGLFVDFDIIVHNARQVILDSPTYPESDHNYADRLEQTKTFTYPGAISLAITFSRETALEDNYDYILISDGNGNEIASYTGTEAAGKTLTIPGDTFRITLTSDAATNAYGYAFDRIVACMELIHTVVIDPATVSCTQDGLTQGSHCAVCDQILVKQEPAKALGHDYDIQFAWSNDHRRCAVQMVCLNRCGDQIYMDCRVSEDRSDPSCVVYTATAQYNGMKVKDVYVEQIRCTVLGAISVGIYFWDDQPAVAKLFKDGVEVASMVAEHAIYQFDDLIPGDYTVEITKKNYGKKIINVTLTEGTVIEPVAMQILGDITGDGKVNVADVAKIYGYIKRDIGLSKVDPACDISGDGKLTVLDTVRIYAHVTGKKSLHQ